MAKKVLAFLLAVTLCTILVACDFSDYKQAEELYAAGDYAAAFELYSALGEYEDSQNKALMCKYEIANTYFQVADYKTALEIYTELGEYEDSQNKALMCKYEIANTYFQAADYKTALEIYTELGEYEDATDKAEICEREVGMSENADYQFLEDIELSVNTRNEMVEKNNSALTYLSAELAILKDYYNASFYDSELKALAKKYIDGINEQKDALELEYCDYQIKWYSGLVKRYQALCDLHSKYQVFDDDVNFKSIYVAQLSYWETLLAGVRAIDSDLTKQLDGITFGYKSSYQMTAPYKNNTKYDFNIQFYFTFYDRNGVRVDESTTYFSNIQAGENCTLEFWCPSTWSTCEFFWEIDGVS